MKYPDIRNPNLAYETGLHIGDGCLSREKNFTYRFSYSGNNKDERTFYRKVVIPLIKGLYGFNLKLRKWKNTCYVRVCSKDLMFFKSEVLDLPIGNKGSLKRLPELFMYDNILSANLIAGLFDSDGSISTNRGKYPRISLGLKTRSIIKEVKIYLENIGISSTMFKNEYYDKRTKKTSVVWALNINGIENFRKFIEIIPLRNIKYKNRISKFLAFKLVAS